MLVEIPRTDGVGQRVLVPGHPELPECDRADHKGKT
jgi:hypothetical protein